MKNHILKISIFVIVIFIIINNFIFFPGNILSWDVFGYYLYLPMKFIYHDLAINDISIVNSIIAKYNNTSNFYQAMILPDGNYVMKYSMGISLFYSPFFFIAHLISKILNFAVDGFSAPYQISLFIGSIIYSLLGIWALSKVLLHFFNKIISAITLILIVFSTNYIIHITMYGQNAMSHNYLFMTYSFIIWLTILWHKFFKLKYMILLAFFCGITILSRPTEIVCLLIPLFWSIEGIKTFKEKLKLLLKYKTHLLVFVLIVLLFGAFQLIYWKIHTNKFLFYSYGANPGEGFEFFHPYISEVLFSFRKGWLLYTPIMIFSIIGFYFIYIYDRSIFHSVLFYFLINLYIVSCWSCWWYAQTYSQRALIPSYPIMAIGLGYFLTWLAQQTKILKGIVFFIIVSFVFLNLFQIIQFHNGIIDGDRMTKEYYFKVFGKMQATTEDKKLLLVNRTFYNGENFENQNEYYKKLLKKLDFEDSSKNDTTHHLSGRHSFKLDSLTKQTISIESPYSEITKKEHTWLKVTAKVYPTKDVNTNPFSLVIHFVHNGYPYKYITFDSEKMKIELNKWNEITYYYLTPEVRRKSNNLKVYFLNKGKAQVFIDDLQVEVYEKK